MAGEVGCTRRPGVISPLRPADVLHQPGPRPQSGAPVVAVPGLGLTVDVSRRLPAELGTEAYPGALPAFLTP